MENNERVDGATPADETPTEDTAKETGADKKRAAREALALEKQIKELEEALEAERATAAETADKHLRLAAEYENFRRRATEERLAAYTDGLSGALEKLLPVFDNLARAAAFGTEGGEQLAAGLALIAKSCEEALTAMGVTAYGEVGESFDPSLHNAVMHEEREDKGEGEITAVHQKGYKKGDRILRYAMVTVAN